MSYREVVVSAYEPLPSVKPAANPLLKSLESLKDDYLQFKNGEGLHKKL